MRRTSSFSSARRLRQMTDKEILIFDTIAAFGISFSVVSNLLQRDWLVAAFFLFIWVCIIINVRVVST